MGTHQPKKQRLDKILVDRHLFSTRSQAEAAILAGKVLVEGQTEMKAGRHVQADTHLEVVEGPVYVSRGGDKLERAFDAFDLNVAGLAALDAGASTGGFTDCLLQRGARKVIAVDVGYGQLDWRLRNDDRVEVLERTNVRYLKCEDLSELPQVATLDLSFISLKKVVPSVVECLSPGFEIVTLVKPQFEAGREKVGRGGVVRSVEVHREVLQSLWDFFEGAGLRVEGLAESPVTGPKGNIEYLMHLIDARASESRARIEATPPLEKDAVIDEVVARAQARFGPDMSRGHLGDV